MKIERKENGTLTSTISITLSKEDYEGKFMDELRKYRSKAQIKGFRKGKTPMGFIKKMYGQALLTDIVFEKFQEHLDQYIKDEGLKIIGQPLPAQDQQPLEVDANQLDEYTLSFDVGLTPDFEVGGLEEEHVLHKVNVPEDTVQEELNVGRRKLGKQIEIEDSIEEKDMLTISAWELAEGEKKEKGWETGFTVLVESIADENLKKDILSNAAGYEFDFDIYELEADKDEKYVKKYLLNMDDEEDHEVGRMFRGKIDKVMRLKEADLDADFFSSYFGNADVSNEEDARTKIREELEKFYVHQAKSVMNREVMEVMMEKTEIELPEDFLKRWLKQANKETTEEQIEKEFPAFRDNFKWTLIKNTLSDRYEIKVEYEDLIAAMRQKVSSYMQGYPMDESFVNDMVNRLMSNQEQVNRVYEEIQAQKVFENLEKDLKLVEKEISLDEFRDIVKKLNESVPK